GDSDRAKIGSRVFVVGAPFGLGHSFSSGYVSGYKRNLQDKNPFTKYEYIQTDASINTGNSGGPMFNLQGEVIGIVSNILTKSGGFEGIGFATTSNLTRELLIEKKHFWSGAEIIPLTGKIAEIFNLPQKTGFLVQKVVFSSALGVIGVKGGDVKMNIAGQDIIVGGDIILSFNGIKIEESDDTLVKIANLMEKRNTDDPIQVTVLRAGKTVVLGRMK
ncbi:MAG: trypsin-like peptidase domain-containing protein, partial [Flavobacteriaceae bacterium]